MLYPDNPRTFQQHCAYSLVSLVIVCYPAVRVPFNSIVLGLQSHVSMMQLAAQGMTTIMNSVLQLGAMEEGLFHIALNVDSISAMLSSVVYQLTPWANTDNIMFVVEIDPAIPPALLFDTQRLSQVSVCMIDSANPARCWLIYRTGE